MFGFYTSIDPKQDLTAGGVAGREAKGDKVSQLTGKKSSAPSDDKN